MVTPASLPRLSPLLVAGLLGVVACTRASPGESGADSGKDTAVAPDSGDSGGAETGESGGEDSEDTGPALPEPGVATTGALWRVVQVPSEDIDPLYVVVFYPEDPTMNAYDEGAPVVLTANPSFTVEDGWETTPRSFFIDGFGLVEVTPVYPGWNAGGWVSGGEPDAGGALCAAAIRDAARFAAGETTTPEGWTLEDVTGHPIRHDAVLLSALSSGGTTALQALDEHADTLAGILSGFSTYEVPTLPQLLTGDVGSVWMDPDPLDDRDGDGVTWDDGRNLAITNPPCDRATCAVDYSRLRWTEAFAIGDVWTQYASDERGVLYLDNNGNGELDADFAAGTLDADGSGTIDADEDFVILPIVGVGLGPHWTFSEEALAAAPWDTWPDNVVDADTTAAFWAMRSPMSRLAGLADRYGTGFAMGITYTEVDHGAALPERPHLTMLHDALTEAGFSVRYNAERDVAECLIEDRTLRDWAGGPPLGAVVGEDGLATYAFPENFLDGVSISAGAVAVLIDAVGPFDHCPF